MEVAKFDGGKVLTTNPWGITLLVAIVAIVPTSVTAIVDYVYKPKAVALETAKLDLERRKARTAVYQAALAIPDPTKRQLLLRFLVNARVLRMRADLL